MHMLELTWEEWESIIQYDLGPILEDCTYLSPQAKLQAIEDWWSKNWKFILKACLEWKQYRQAIQEEDRLSDQWFAVIYVLQRLKIWNPYCKWIEHLLDWLCGL